MCVPIISTRSCIRASTTTSTSSFSTLTGAPLAYSNAAAIPYVRSDGYDSIVYTGPDDAHVYELYHYRFSLYWHVGDLSDQAGAPVAFLSEGPAPYVRSDNVNAVVYWASGYNNHIYELSLLGGWHYGDLTDLTGASTPGSAPHPYVRSDGFNVVVYQGTDGHIYELALYPDTWYVGDLTVQAGG
jgi:hypothetical protein